MKVSVITAVLNVTLVKVPPQILFGGVWYIDPPPEPVHRCSHAPGYKQEIETYVLSASLSSLRLFPSGIE
ncbi:hypothetical protein E2C01_076689 [Portunus trituberculatus]|uniref:Uncharacterized protein n=1 Tax=Portunus trituberculatus TaxID=210409 RepID=A0A5B7IIE5_PORTR|nr:hypothetical protein [Portunus trituberculatus]